MFSNMSFCLRDNVEGNCTEHSLSSVNKILQSMSNFYNTLLIYIALRNHR